MFNKKEYLLANEASLTASLLGNGLNALRKADSFNKGLYYQAFFSLSIGIERLLKIIIINKYRCENKENFPTDMNLKEIGHDLIKLLKSLGIKYGKDSLQYKTIKFLSDFAKKSRYYNLDNILNENVMNNDPLSEWHSITSEILDKIKIKKSTKNIEELTHILDSVCVFRFHDMQGNEITNSKDYFAELDQKEIIQSYSVQYVYEIITDIIEEIRKLENIKYMMPVLSEFFVLYNKHLLPYEIRRKKNWLIL